MRLPQCFELYCTPVNDLELLNGRFVDPHYERGFPSLTSLIIIICFHYYQRRLVSLVLASPPHLYHMSYFFAFLFTSCFFPRKKKISSLLSNSLQPSNIFRKLNFYLQDQISLFQCLPAVPPRSDLYTYLLDSLFLNFFFVRELERVARITC